MLKLGTPVRDKITGFKGVLVGHVDYISGCSQGLVSPKVAKDGSFKESNWFDDQRIITLEQEAAGWAMKQIIAAAAVAISLAACVTTNTTPIAPDVFRLDTEASGLLFTGNAGADTLLKAAQITMRQGAWVMADSERGDV